jgi:hypothetical protein
MNERGVIATPLVADDDSDIRQVGKATQFPRARQICVSDESEKLVAGLGGLLHGEQSTHQRAAQLTAGLGVDRWRPGADTSRSTGLAGSDMTCRFREQQSERHICAVLSLMPVGQTNSLRASRREMSESLGR